jgi:branched-chain amino acid transport system substrate-binding protein
MMGPKLKLRVIGGLFSVALALMCGSASAEVGVTDDTIKIGMFGPLQGKVSLYGYPINNGPIAIYKEINETGGIHGRKIEIVHEDGDCNPQKTAAAVKKLIHQEKVFMIHGGSCSGAVFGGIKEIKDTGIPFMIMAATMDKLATPTVHNIFRPALSGSADGMVMLEFLATMPGVKRIAVVRHSNDWANAKSSKFLAQVASRGIEIVSDEEMERKATDATAQVLRHKKAKPDAVATFLYPAEAALYTRDAAKYGLDVPMLGTNSVMDIMDLKKRAGGLGPVKNFYSAAFVQAPMGDFKTAAYRALMTKHFPDDRPQSLNLYGMGGAYAILEALTRAGRDLTREGLISALETLDGTYAGPMTCTLKFTKDQHEGCIGGTMWTLSADGNTIIDVGPAYRDVK